MTVPAHVKVTYSGVIGPILTPLEQWSFSINFDTGTLVAGLAEACKTAFVNNVGARLATDVSLTRTRVALMSDGTHVNQTAEGAYEQQDSIVTFTGGGVPKKMPLQSALVATLLTGRAGPTGKGRIFLPWPDLDLVVTDRLLHPLDSQEIATKVKTMLTSLNALTGLGTAVVASSKGYLSPITGVKVGRRPDVLRSRARSQREVPGAVVTLA